MKIKLLILLFFGLTIICKASPTQNDGFTQQQKQVWDEYAREYLKKNGLVRCISLSVNDKEIKNIFSQAGAYYFSRGFHYNADEMTDVFFHNIRPYIKQFNETLPSDLNDIEKINRCLTLYHSDEYQQLINQQDKYIVYERSSITNDFLNNPDYENKTMPYKLLKNEAFQISLWGFYECLSHLTSDSITKQLLLDEAKSIRNRLHYSDNQYNNLRQRYAQARKKYDFGHSHDVSNTTERVNLGCIILFDSNNLNNMID